MRGVVRTILGVGAGLLLLCQPAGCGETLVRSEVAGFYIYAPQPVNGEAPIVRQAAATIEQVCRTLRIPVPQERLEIHCFASRWDYDDWLGRHYPEFAHLDSCYIRHKRRHMILTYRRSDLERVLRHEVTHYVLHASIANIPRWLDEGIAQYFELESGSPWRQASRLAALRGYLRLQQNGPVLADLMQVQTVHEFKREQYLQAWGWCRFMLDYSPGMRRKLLVALSQMRIGPIASDQALAMLLAEVGQSQTLRQQFRDYYLR